MSVFRPFFLYLCLYVSGLALYSTLFAVTANQSAMGQMLKVGVAGVHSLIFVLPAIMAQSRSMVVRWVGWLILISYFVYILFLTSYFSYFGFVPELYAFNASNAADASEVLGHYFVQVFGLSEIVILISAAVFFYLLPRRRMGRGAFAVLALPVLLFGASLVSFGSPIKSSEFGNTTVVRRFGIVPFTYVSMNEWFSFESGYLASQTPFPGKLASIAYPQDISAPLVVDQPQGVDRVILVQIESFDPQAIEAELNGQQIMPFVSDLQESCLNYTNFFTTKSVGGSADSEFSVATGLLPSSKRAAIRYADFENLPTLYDRLRDQGVASYFVHNNHIGFYGRNIAYDQLPSVEHRFLQPGENISERAFADQTLSNALTTSDRFFYYFFNFQSHGPYMGYSDDTARALSVDTNDTLQNYYASMHEVDQMIASLFALQRTDFDTGNSVFIVTADHPSHLHPEPDEIDKSRIPMLVCHDSFRGRTVDKVASTIDLFPTVLELFGANLDTPVIAQNLLADTDNVVLFPTGTMLRQSADRSVAAERCGPRCSRFMDYTDQHIRLSE